MSSSSSFPFTSCEVVEEVHCVIVQPSTVSVRVLKVVLTGNDSSNILLKAISDYPSVQDTWPI